MANTAERGHAVRQRLLRAATELITEQGWAAVSTRTLAQRAGVTPGVVHYHFTSLRALLIEAAMGVVRDLVGGLADLLEHAETPSGALDLVLAGLDDYSGRDPISLLVTETYLVATRDDDLRAEVDAVLTDFRRQLADWLRAHGFGSADETAAVFAAAIDGVMLHRAVDPSLTGDRVGPILRRLLTETGFSETGHSETGHRDEEKERHAP